MSGPPPGPLSPLAGALHAAVAAHRGSKVALVALREAAQTADLSMAASPEARERLASALAELELAGLLTQPKSRALWDRGARPPLPLHVNRTRLAPVAANAGPARLAEPVWHALLSWVPAFLASGRPTPAERTLLVGAQQLLAATGAPPVRVVPLRERSLELLGDEKALDSLLRGRLFLAGRLTLELLGAQRVVPALAATDTSRGADVLLVENFATYFTLGRALVGHANVGRVIWGAGNQVTQLLPQVSIRPGGRIWYFGDLDVRGLEIGAAATATAAALGLPRLAPSTDLYMLLLTHGRRAPVGGRVPSPGRVGDAVEWLPEALRPIAAPLLRGGLRLAQEAVGVDLLAGLSLPDPLH